MVDDQEIEATEEEQYEEAWDELSAADDATPDEDEEIEVNPDDEELLDDDQDSDDSEETGEFDQNDIEKRLSETQKWGHELAAKVKDLEGKLSSQEKGTATQAEVDAAQQEIDEAQAQFKKTQDSLFQEFPEFKPVLEPLLHTMNALQEKVNELSQSSTMSADAMAQQNALTNFESNIKPKVVEEIPEFDQIIASNDYWQWAARQRPALQTAAMYSDDSDDIIWALKEFKKANSGGEIKAEKDKQNAQKAKRKKNAHSPKPGSQSFSNSKTDKTDQSYDDAWNDLEKKREKNGGKLPRIRR